MVRRRTWARGVLAVAALAPLGAAAQTSTPAGTDLSPLTVVAPTPLGGAGVAADKLPGVTESLAASDFSRTGSLAVTQALEQRVAGVSLSDTQGNALTRDLNFRGFQASALQGTPQGLAVYMNGVRLNEGFGDTVNWDLIPQVAIARADLFTSNPAFGLNALGGAVALRMKNGFTATGADASVQSGSFGQRQASAQYGATAGPWAIYLAGDGGREDGWRRSSGWNAARLLGDLGWRRGPAEAHLTLAGARNRLGVVGPTPVDLLSQDRRAVYTFPQTSLNKSALAALNGKLDLSGGWSLQGVAYARRFKQAHVDGNDGDFQGCSGDPADPLYGALCLDDEGFPDEISPGAEAFQVLAEDGAPIPCPPVTAGQNRPCGGVPYGSIDRTWTDGRSWGGSVQVANSGRLWGRTNLLAIGASLDRSRIRFAASSTLAVIQPDLRVSLDADIPGVGEVIRTAGAIAYSPVRIRTARRDVGLYLTDTLDLTDQLSVTASGRFNRAGIDTMDQTGVSPDLNGRHSFERFNPALGAAWRLGQGITAYGGYSEENRAPTPLELSCSDPLRPCLLENALVADPPLEQVVAHSWEAGLRGRTRLGIARLSWRAGLFQTDNHNDIVALASVIQGRGYYANVPKTRRRGAEASLDLTAGRLSGYLGYSHVEATYRFSGDLPSASSPFADENGDIRVRPGDRIGGVPADRFKIGGDYQLSEALSAGFDVVAAGGQRLVGDEAGQDERLGGYWVTNVHASWRVRRGLELFGQIENLFGRRYATYGAYFETDALENLDPSPLPDQPAPRTVTPAAPRAFAVGLRGRW